MSEIALDYSAAGVEVRGDLRAAHRAVLDHLRRPGSWFSGAERIAVAAESRRASECPLCGERKVALSPEQVAGEHEAFRCSLCRPHCRAHLRGIAPTE